MSKTSKAIPKVGPQLPSEPRGSEFTEEASEGSVRVANLDAPPDTFHAGTFGEGYEETAIQERQMGSTEPLGVWHEDLGEEAATPDESETAEKAVAESTTEDEVGKQPSSEAKAKRSEMIPRERFDEINEKLKAAEKDRQMLAWILENPDQFAKTARKEQEEAKPPTQSFNIEEPKLPDGKTLDELGDKEVFDYAVRKEVSRVLNEHLGGFVKDLNGLKGFKGTMEDLILKSATGSDGKPLFPRWNELAPQVKQAMDRHPTLDKREAYVLAERMVPVQAPYVPPTERPASEPLGKTSIPDQGPVSSPKRGSPEAIRAARLVQLGRASGAYNSNAKPGGPREAVELAMRELGFPDE